MTKYGRKKKASMKKKNPQEMPLDFKRHVQICLNDKHMFHPFEKCPWRNHLCNKCHTVVTGYSCSKCKSLKMRKMVDNKNDRFEEMVSQMGDLMLEAQGITDIGVKEETLNRVDSMMDDFVCKLTTQLPLIGNQLFDTINFKVIGKEFGKGCFDGVKESTESLFKRCDQWSIVTSILIDLCLIFRCRKDPLSAILVVTSMLARSGLGADIVDWLVGIWREYLHEGTGEMQAQSGSTSLMYVFLALIHVLVLGVKPNVVTLSAFIGNVCRLSSSVRSVQDLFGSIKEVGESLFDWFMYSICGFTTGTTADVEGMVFHNWIDSVDKLWRCKARKETTWTFADLKTFDKVYSSMVELRKNSTWLNQDRTLSILFSSRGQMMLKMEDEIAASGVRQQSRIEPYMFYMFGESGVGKSLMTPLVATRFLAKFHPEELKRNNNDYISCVFTRKSGDPRWDGVGDQCVYVYDDYGQVKDTASAPNTELMETIELCNTVPFTPLMAECSKKGRVQLAPEFIIHTSNVIFPHVVSLSKELAVARRFDMIVEVLPKPEVSKAGKMLDIIKVRDRHARDECGCSKYGFVSDICVTACEFQRWEVVPEARCSSTTFKHVCRGDPIEFEELMSIMIDEMEVKRHQRVNRKKFMKQVAEHMLAQCGGDDNSEYVMASDGDPDETLVKQRISDLGYDIPEGITIDVHHVAEPRSKLYDKIKSVIEDGKSKFKKFVEDHPMITAIGVGFSVMASMFAVAKIFGGEKLFVSENDDSIKRTTNSRSKRSVFAENDDSIKRGNQRSNRRSVFAESNVDGVVNESWLDRISQWWTNRTCKTMVVQGMNDPELDMVMRKIYRQVYVILSMDHREMGSGLIVKGRLMVTFGHVRPYLEEGFVLKNVSNGRMCTVPGLTNVVDVGMNSDIVMIELPRIVPCGADVVQHFPRDSEVIQDDMFDARLMSFTGPFVKLHYGPAKAYDKEIEYESRLGDIVIRKHYGYQFDTKVGYCGSLLFRSDPSGQGKLIGMHVAGSAKSSYGISSALCRESIIGAIGAFTLESQCSFPIEQYAVDLVPKEEFVALGGLGHSDYGISEPKDSKLKKTPMYGWDGPPIKQPAVLDGFNADGKPVKAVAREKLMCGKQPPIKTEYLELARRTVLHQIRKYSGKSRKIWSIEEAVFGGEDQYCDMLDLKTSSGMPWKLERPGSGKRAFIFPTRREIAPKLRGAVCHRSELASRGERLMTIWSDHYKDELRLVAGNKYLKPRLFSGGPIDFLIVFRQFFGQFTSEVMRGRIMNGVAVGINPHGSDWTVLAKTLDAMSDDIFCGDFSCYDGTLHTTVLWAVLDLINDWYDDEHRLLRSTLFEEIVCAVHLSRNEMYEMDHGNPSGNPLTSILNSVYQLVASYYVMLCMGKSLIDIKKNFWTCTYGDDNINAVKTGGKFLDLEEYADAFQVYLGMRLTCSNKVGLPKYIRLQEADFLSRGFRLENGVYYAPRPWENLSLLFNWSKGDLWEAKVLPEYTRTVYFELAHYPPDEFEYYVDKINKYLMSHKWVGDAVYTQQYYRETFHELNAKGTPFEFCFGL